MTFQIEKIVMILKTTNQINKTTKQPTKGDTTTYIIRSHDNLFSSLKYAKVALLKHHQNFRTILEAAVSHETVRKGQKMYRGCIH